MHTSDSSSLISPFFNLCVYEAYSPIENEELTDCDFCHKPLGVNEDLLIHRHRKGRMMSIEEHIVHDRCARAVQDVFIPCPSQGCKSESASPNWKDKNYSLWTKELFIRELKKCGLSLGVLTSWIFSDALVMAGFTALITQTGKSASAEQVKDINLYGFVLPTAIVTLLITVIATACIAHDVRKIKERRGFILESTKV